MARYQVKPPEPTYVEAVRLPDWVRSMRLTNDEKNLGERGLWQFPLAVDGVYPDLHEALWLVVHADGRVEVLTDSEFTTRYMPVSDLIVAKPFHRLPNVIPVIPVHGNTDSCAPESVT